VRQAIEAKGCQLLFLPPYFSDLSPIEEAVSQLKAYLIEVMGSTLVGGAERVRHHSCPFRSAPDPPKSISANNGKSITESKPAPMRAAPVAALISPRRVPI